MKESTAQQGFSEYKAHPHQFYRLITNQRSKNANPLYSQQSLKKYFRQKSPEQFKEPKYQFYTSRKQFNVDSKIQEKVQKFQQLQALIRKSVLSFNSNRFMKKIDKVEQYVDKSEEHFQSLNFQDGIYPLDSFSRQNFNVKRYITELSTPEKTRRVTLKQKIRQARKRAHAQHIIDYLHQEQIQSRYRVQPKSTNKVDHSALAEDWEVSNTQIRSKTEYCRKRYQPITIQKHKIDDEILEQSRLYMKKSKQKRLK